MLVKIFSRKWVMFSSLVGIAFLIGLSWLLSQQAKIAGANFKIANDHPLQIAHDRVKVWEDENTKFSGSPNAEMPSDFYNFGRIQSKSMVRRDFFIFNKGNAPLLIQQAYTTCGCTTADVSASRIMPGQAAKATIIFDAGFHNVSGQTVRRGLILETNDPAHPEITIWVQAEVAP